MKIRNVRLYTGEEEYKRGALVTEGAYVKYAGPEEGAPEDPETVDGQGGILMSGLANSHTHAAMVLFRGVGSDLGLMDWLGRLMPAEDALTPEMVHDGTLLACGEMLKNGVTAFADMYRHMDAAFEAALESGIRANMNRGSSGRDGVDSHREWAKRWHGAGDGRIRVTMGLHAEYTSDEDTVRYAVETARELGLGMHLHLSETEGEVAGCVERHGVRPVEYFDRMGLFDGPVIAAHCVHINDEERALLARKGVWMAHCPASNLKLGSGVFDLVGALDAGCRVCLGTDGASSNNGLDMYREMYLTALLPKGMRKDPTRPRAGECVNIATRHGCLAMGYEDVGLLRPGYRADWVLLKDDVGLMPGHDAAADIVYAAQGGMVRMTAVNGRVLYRDGVWADIDMERVKARCREHARTLGVL